MWSGTRPSYNVDNSRCNAKSRQYNITEKPESTSFKRSGRRQIFSSKRFKIEQVKVWSRIEALVGGLGDSRSPGRGQSPGNWSSFTVCVVMQTYNANLYVCKCTFKMHCIWALSVALPPITLSRCASILQVQQVRAAEVRPTCPAHRCHRSGLQGSDPPAQPTGAIGHSCGGQRHLPSP